MPTRFQLLIRKVGKKLMGETDLSIILVKEKHTKIKLRWLILLASTIALVKL